MSHQKASHTLGQQVTETLGGGNASVEFTFTIPVNTTEVLLSSTPPATDAIYYNVYLNNTLTQTGNYEGGYAFDHPYTPGSWACDFMQALIRPSPG